MDDGGRNAAILVGLFAAGAAASVALDGLEFTLSLVMLVLALWLIVPRTRP